MAVDSKHPSYLQKLPVWLKLRDVYAGSDTVKAKGERYLPKTQGMANAGKVGDDRYFAYKQRAEFDPVLGTSVSIMMGVMHQKPPEIELPAVMDPLREAATPSGENLDQLLRKINEQQLVTGRCGLFLDVSPAAELPYISFYTGESIINWDDGRRDAPSVEQALNLVVLQESENERINDFEWEFRDKYRVLIIGDPDENETEGLYRAAVFREKEGVTFSETELITPNYRGRTLDFVPFVFVNAMDLLPDPGTPPYEGLCDSALAIYRLSADYNLALHMQAQDTLVITGNRGEADGGYAIGAGAVIELTSEAKAEFIGVKSDGIPHMRQALQDIKNLAIQQGGQLLETVSREKESSAALKTRVAAKTASLNLIALNGAAALERSLKQMATWIGANPEEVSVKPNLDFDGSPMLARSLVELMTARSMGAPISKETIHRMMSQHDVTELDFETEMAKIEEEDEAEMEASAAAAEEFGLPMPGQEQQGGADNVQATDDTDQEASDAQPNG